MASKDSLFAGYCKFCKERRERCEDCRRAICGCEDCGCTWEEWDIND